MLIKVFEECSALGKWILGEKKRINKNLTFEKHVQLRPFLKRVLPLSCLSEMTELTLL